MYLAYGLNSLPIILNQVDVPPANYAAYVEKCKHVLSSFGIDAPIAVIRKVQLPADLLSSSTAGMPDNLCHNYLWNLLKCESNFVQWL